MPSCQLVSGVIFCAATTEMSQKLQLQHVKSSTAYTYNNTEGKLQILYNIYTNFYVALLGQMHYALVSNYMVICPFFFLGPWLRAEHKIYWPHHRARARASLEPHCSKCLLHSLPCEPCCKDKSIDTHRYALLCCLNFSQLYANFIKSLEGQRVR